MLQRLLLSMLFLGQCFAATPTPCVNFNHVVNLLYICCYCCCLQDNPTRQPCSLYPFQSCCQFTVHLLLLLLFTGQYYAATMLLVSISILLLIYITFVVVYRTKLRGNHAPCVHFNLVVNLQYICFC